MSTSRAQAAFAQAAKDARPMRGYRRPAQLAMQGITPTLPFKTGRASWQAGWREIGGVRKYYRSKWEMNFAKYLQWLQDQGQIKKWEHEAETFWFEKIKRGTRSYLPDFRVTENSGLYVYYEVKGWMTPRSRTALDRMKRYYPDVKLHLIDAKAYAGVKRKIGAACGFE